MNSISMKGFTQSWFEICSTDGHPLVLDRENLFESEDLAAAYAAKVCVEYRDTVTVKMHTTEIRRIFHVEINAVEV